MGSGPPGELVSAPRPVPRTQLSPSSLIPALATLDAFTESLAHGLAPVVTPAWLPVHTLLFLCRASVWPHRGAEPRMGWRWTEGRKGGSQGTERGAVRSTGAAQQVLRTQKR